MTYSSMISGYAKADDGSPFWGAMSREGEVPSLTCTILLLLLSTIFRFLGEENEITASCISNDPVTEVVRVVRRVHSSHFLCPPSSTRVQMVEDSPSSSVLFASFFSKLGLWPT